MTRRFRAAIIGDTGRGDYGHFLELAYQGLPNVDVVAVADTDPVGVERARQRIGAARAYLDYREMLARESLDLVSVCPRWVNNHAEMVLVCAEAGVKGIFCEKPFAATLAEADTMLAACDRSGVRLAVAQRRAGAYEQHAKKLIEQGAIGQVQMIRRHGKADHRAGAMDMAILGIHILDNMRFLAGADVAWAYGHVTQDGCDVTLDDIRSGDEGVGLVAGNGLFAYYAFQNGVIGYCDSSQGDATDKRLEYGWLGLEVHGTEGILALRSTPLGELYLYPHRLWLPGQREGQWQRITLDDWDTHSDGRPRSVNEILQLSNRMIAQELVQAIEEERDLSTSVCSGQDARAALEMMMAIHESHRLKTRVDFPLANRENPYETWLRERR